MKTPRPQQAGGFIKDYRVHIENSSHWLTSKQSISNHVSLCQDMCFLLAFPQQIASLRYSIELKVESLKTMNKL